MLQNRINIAKDGAIAVINTLSFIDFIGIVQFNDNATSLYTDKIVRATK